MSRVNDIIVGRPTVQQLVAQGYQLDEAYTIRSFGLYLAFDRQPATDAERKAVAAYNRGEEGAARTFIAAFAPEELDDGDAGDAIEEEQHV